MSEDVLKSTLIYVKAGGKLEDPAAHRRSTMKLITLNTHSLIEGLRLAPCLAEASAGLSWISWQGQEVNQSQTAALVECAI